MLAAQPLILPAQIGALADVERKPHGIERAPPQLAVGQRAAKHCQTVGFLAAILRALIGDIGGGRGAVEQERALAIVARLDLQHRAGQPQPVRGVVRRGGDELAEHHHAVAEIRLAEGGIGVAAQLRRRFGHLTGVAFDLCLKLDCRFVELLALKGLVGGKGRQHGKGEQRSGKAGADARKHGGTSRRPGHSVRWRSLLVQRAMVSRTWLSSDNAIVEDVSAGYVPNCKQVQLAIGHPSSDT